VPNPSSFRFGADFGPEFDRVARAGPEALARGHARGGGGLVDTLNLIYVTVTRARKRLYLTDAARAFFAHLRACAGHEQARAAPAPGRPVTRSGSDPSARRIALEAAYAAFAEQQPPTDRAASPRFRRLDQLDRAWLPGPTPTARQWEWLGLDPQMPRAATKKYLNRLSLRYHPDKFMARWRHYLAPALVAAVQSKLGENCGWVSDARRGLEHAPGPERPLVATTPTATGHPAGRGDRPAAIEGPARKKRRRTAAAAAAAAAV